MLRIRPVALDPVWSPGGQPSDLAFVHSLEGIEMSDFVHSFAYPVGVVELPDDFTVFCQLQCPSAVRLDDQEIPVRECLEAARSSRMERCRFRAGGFAYHAPSAWVQRHDARALRAEKIVEEDDATVGTEAWGMLHAEGPLLRPAGHAFLHVDDRDGVEHPHRHERVPGAK